MKPSKQAVGRFFISQYNCTYWRIVMKTVEDAITFIHSRPKGGQKESLHRMFALLNALDNPQEQLPPAIHVTGTNGKGSVSTMASNILRVAGYRTGLFISPYIVNFRERIQINNQWIAEQDLLAVAQLVEKKLITVDQQLAPDVPTEFEVLTAIMMTYFARENLDALVIEVGIGGQLDSTNVMPNATVAVITSVGLDHQALLGDTIAAIAEQKAGIIHDNMAVVIGELPEAAQWVIEKRSKRPLIHGHSGQFEQGLPGQYQVQNTATAVAAVNAFDESITVEQIQNGLKQSQFAARFETIRPGIIIDGAHNYQGLMQLVTALNTGEYEKQTKTLIIGSLMDKNVVLAFSDILTQAKFDIVLVPFTGPNGRHSLNISSVAKQYAIKTADSWQTAFHESHSDMTIFTGSLYFVSEVRNQL